MVEPISFALGAVASLLSFKLARVCYRVYPYFLKPSLIKQGQEECVIIAGATDGIGLEYVRRFSGSFKIVAIGRNLEKLESLKQISPGLLAYQIDFNDGCLREEHIQQSLSNLMKQEQLERMKIRGIVNCVGMASFAPFSATPLGQIAKINQANIDSQLYLLKLLYGLRQKEQLASNPFFINLSSGAANYPNKFSSAYAGTKAYLSNVMAVMSKEEKAVAFLDLKPWFVKTKMTGYINTWDTVMPEEVVDGSMRLLGRKTVGSGSWKHELIEQFRFICLRIIERRTEEQQARLEKIKAIRNKRANKESK